MVCSVARICVVDGKKFLDTMRREHMCFAIFPKDGKEEVENVLTEVANLLGDFSNIVSNNVPNGLPPVWKISHQLDLIPGASFPNKVVYRMTLVESEELKKNKLMSCCKRG